MKALTVALIAVVALSCVKTADKPEQQIQTATASSLTVQRDTGSAAINSWWWDECTNEQVNFAAVIHWNNLLVYKGEYGYSRWYLTNSRTKLTDVTAIGATSRKKYRAININGYTSLQDSSFNTHRYAHHAMLRIIAPGKGSTMIVKEKIVLVTNQKGTTVVDIEKESATCK
jgi:hypothetical protein